MQPDLAPLIDEPDADGLIWLVDAARRQFETQVLGAGLLQQSFCPGARILDIGPIPRNPPPSPASSSRLAASGEPGKTMPPTVRTLAILDNASAPCQRSIARDSARRTRTSSNGFFWSLIQTTLPQFQSLSCTASLSPSA